jgi:hypothetical protein
VVKRLNQILKAMEVSKVYSGNTEDEIWQQLATDINEETSQYYALLHQDTTEIYLEIDIDLGGGFEGGYATTSYSAPLINTDFQFAIHEEHFIDEIGKFFGMQDIQLGYPDLDHHLVVKTNNEEKVKMLFADEHTRALFTDLNDFDFGIRMHTPDGSDTKQAFLELNIEDGILDTIVLREIYHVFRNVLTAL